ncbi:MAG: 6-phosphofructokinase, partial [Solirubrobacterales bacterium]
PGLNPCIKAIVTAAHDAGVEVIGVRRGWMGLLHHDPDDPESLERWTTKLTPADVRTLDRMGGTALHTSRTHPGRVAREDLPGFLDGRFPFDGDGDTADCTPHVLAALEDIGVDTLIPIGGDDTLSYAVRMHEEGVPVFSIPKTMDNDVFGTDYCIGFSTAVTRSVDYINQLRTSTGSHERIAVVELFGRNSGETVLVSAYLADADRALISEVPFDVERLAAMAVADRAANPSNYAMIAVSEGATIAGGEVHERGEEDAYGHRKLGGIGAMLAEELKRETGIKTLSQQVAYLMRSGAPDALDRMVAFSFGKTAVDQLLGGRSGRMVALQHGEYTTVPAETPIQGVKRVDVDALYDSDAYRPVVRDVLGKPMFLY